MPEVTHNQTNKSVDIAQAKLPVRPVISEPEKIPQHIFAEVLKDSKLMSRLLARGGPIEQIPVLGIVNPISDYTGNYALPRPNSTRVRLLPLEILIDNFTAPYSPKECARQILNGSLPNSLILKPDSSSGGNGILKIDCADQYINLSFRNPFNRALPSQQAVYNYALTIPPMLSIGAVTDSLITLRIYKHDLKLAEEVLAEICTRSLTTVFPHENENRFGYTDLNSGLIEPTYSFLSVGNKVVEGRYYFIFRHGTLQLSNGQRMDGTPTPSYLKQGIDENFVNAGSQSSKWPTMHEPIIHELGLNCTNAQFNQTMHDLLTGQILHSVQSLLNLCESPGSFFDSIDAMGFIVDVAWQENQTHSTVESLTDGAIQIPKPIMMEMNTSFKLRPSTL